MKFIFNIVSVLPALIALEALYAYEVVASAWEAAAIYVENKDSRQLQFEQQESNIWYENFLIWIELEQLEFGDQLDEEKDSPDTTFFPSTDFSLLSPARCSFSASLLLPRPTKSIKRYLLFQSLKLDC